MSDNTPTPEAAMTPATDEHIYAKRDIEELGELYIRHVEAMTAEGLHDKSDIAAELAYRDARLDAAEAENKSLNHLLDLIWKVDQQAIAKWQDATGEKKVWPDRGKLVEWLLARLDAERKRADEAEAHAADAQRGWGDTEDELKQAEALLREFQWGCRTEHGGETINVCPACESASWEGHNATCEIGSFLHSPTPTPAAVVRNGEKVK